MKAKIVLILLCLIFALVSFAQVAVNDSILFKNKYYLNTDPEYEPIKAWLNVGQDKNNFEAFFMPGLGYTFYSPKGQDSTGLF